MEVLYTIILFLCTIHPSCSYCKNFIYSQSGKQPMPKSSPDQREIIYLEIEKSRISREKAKVVLDKSLLLYVVFMLVGILGFAFEYIDSFLLNVLVVLGIVILIIGTLPYLIISHREEQKINNWLKRLKGS